MNDNEKQVKLYELMEKFHAIGKCDYNGKIYDNVMSIFDELSLEDQKHFLRGCLGMYIIMASPLIHSQEVIDSREIDEIFSHIELLRFRNIVVVDGKSGHIKKTEHDQPEEKQQGIIDLELVKNGGILLITLMVLHVFYIALMGDSNSLQSILIYKKLFDFVQVFFK